jgi:AraC-like DNA-binding protein
VSLLRKNVPKPIIPSPLLLDALVPRQRWRFLRTELVWAYYGKTSPQHSAHCTYVPHTSAWLILQGNARVRTAGGLCSAHDAQWLIAPPGERWQQTSTDCLLLSICFVWQWIFGHELFPLQSGVKLESGDFPGLKTRGFRLAKQEEHLFPGARNELPQRSGSLEAHLKLQTDFTAWLVQFSNAMAHHRIRPCLMKLDPRVEEAVQILSRPEGNRLRPTELSKQLGVSQSQMNRLFLSQLGTTVHGYCERQKLASARIFLGGSGLSVKETAFRLGFRSPQHFSRWFRKHSGFAPTQLRRANTTMI